MPDVSHNIIYVPYVPFCSFLFAIGNLLCIVPLDFIEIRTFLHIKNIGTSSYEQINQTDFIFPRIQRL